MFLTLVKHWDALAVFVASLFAFVWMQQVKAPHLFLGIFLGLLFFLLYFLNLRNRGQKKFRTIAIASVLTLVGGVLLMLLLEWPSVRLFVSFLTSACLGVLVVLPRKLNKEMAHEYKPWRRITSMIFVLDTYAFCAGFFGLGLFFQNIGSWVFALLASAVCSLSAILIWRLYYKGYESNIYLWSAVIALISFELFWIFGFLPFGYLVLGLFVTWVWYIVQLLVRFHSSVKGIVWRKQRWFMFGNIIAFILILFLIRWI